MPRLLKAHSAIVCEIVIPNFRGDARKDRGLRAAGRARVYFADYAFLLENQTERRDRIFGTFPFPPWSERSIDWDIRTMQRAIRRRAIFGGAGRGPMAVELILSR